MKVQNLTRRNEIYTSNVYLVTGDWNAMEDVNTLIDVGRDPAVLDLISNASTGVGKHRVEQVILTHGHYDHTSLLPTIRALYSPRVYAFQPNIGGVDEALHDRMKLRVADREFEVIHAPGHSTDSVCLYCEAEETLFAGDTQLAIHTTEATYGADFVSALEYLSTKRIKVVHFGHGRQVVADWTAIIERSIANILPTQGVPRDPVATTRGGA